MNPACGCAIEKGFYARYGDGGTCSQACMRAVESKESYPDHSEAEFLSRLGLAT